MFFIVLYCRPLEFTVIQSAKHLAGGLQSGHIVYLIGVQQGLSMVRKLGRFVEFSVFGETTTVDWFIIGDRKEIHFPLKNGKWRLNKLLENMGILRWQLHFDTVWQIVPWMIILFSLGFRKVTLV